jgi:hypothetical protein
VEAKVEAELRFALSEVRAPEGAANVDKARQELEAELEGDGSRWQTRRLSPSPEMASMRKLAGDAWWQVAACGRIRQRWKA